MTHYFLAPDPSEEAVKLALSASACPLDVAVVRVDAVSGVVSVETPDVWRADKNGREEGLGVDGWRLLESRTGEQRKELVEQGKDAADRAPPVDVKAEPLKA